MKLHTGDTVVVITGKDKGKTGTIMRVLSTEHRVVIGGVNMRTRHMRKTPQQAGRIIRYEASIHASNVMLIDPKTKKRTRVGYVIDAEGVKKRISKKSGAVVIPVKAVRKPAAKNSQSGAEAPTVTTESAPPAAEVAAPPKKQPFWKRMKFGSRALEEGEVHEEPHMKQDHTIPDQQLHVRKGARGS